jgi:hypothetical protein
MPASYADIGIRQGGRINWPLAFAARLQPSPPTWAAKRSPMPTANVPMTLTLAFLDGFDDFVGASPGIERTARVGIAVGDERDARSRSAS